VHRPDITAIVDGTSDKSGLPDPRVLEHCVTFKGDKIAGLSYRLADEESGT
jgi:hypothetical protein